MKEPMELETSKTIRGGPLRLSGAMLSAKPVAMALEWDRDDSDASIVRKSGQNDIILQLNILSWALELCHRSSSDDGLTFDDFKVSFSQRFIGKVR